MCQRLLSPTELVDDRADLVRPRSLTVDGDHDAATARHLVRIAQLLYAFWHTGDPNYLRQAMDEKFVDKTLPPGRPQGTDGVPVASKQFHAAVPDLTCELCDLLIAGDNLAVRLQFRGHFTGTFNGVRGSGQEIDFIAFDIQHVGDEKIAEDWHLEDMATFLRQAELLSLPGA